MLYIYYSFTCKLEILLLWGFGGETRQVAVRTTCWPFSNTNTRCQQQVVYRRQKGGKERRGGLVWSLTLFASNARPAFFSRELIVVPLPSFGKSASTAVRLAVEKKFSSYNERQHPVASKWQQHEDRVGTTPLFRAHTSKVQRKHQLWSQRGSSSLEEGWVGGGRGIFLSPRSLSIEIIAHRNTAWAKRQHLGFHLLYSTAKNCVDVFEQSGTPFLLYLRNSGRPRAPKKKAIFQRNAAVVPVRDGGGGGGRANNGARPG